MKFTPTNDSSINNLGNFNQLSDLRDSKNSEVSFKNLNLHKKSSKKSNKDKTLHQSQNNHVEDAIQMKMVDAIAQKVLSQLNVDKISKDPSQHGMKNAETVNSFLE